MAETVGVSATSGLPTDQVQLLQLIVLELRVISIYLKEGFSHTDEPYRLRADLAKNPEIIVS